MLGANLAAAWAYRDLARHLVLRDLRHKYKGSALGVVWSLANPLIMAAAYTVAFQYIIRVPIDRFPLFLLSGLIPWTFFTTGLSAATASVADNGALVRKVAFPRLTLPVAAVLTPFIQFVLTYAVILAVFGAIDGPRAAWLTLPVIMILQLAFTIGLGLFGAAAYVHARDTRHLLEVAVQVWFWLTPVVYSLELVPARLAAVLRLNPMTWFIETYHRIVVDGRPPTAEALALLAVVTASAVVPGLMLFARRERRFAELI